MGIKLAIIGDSLTERAEKTPPFIDWRLYADWNALMVMALLEASVALDDKKYASLARKVLATLDALCVNADGSVTHSATLPPPASPRENTRVGRG